MPDAFLLSAVFGGCLLLFQQSHPRMRGLWKGFCLLSPRRSRHRRPGDLSEVTAFLP